MRFKWALKRAYTCARRNTRTASRMRMRCDCTSSAPAMADRPGAVAARFRVIYVGPLGYQTIHYASFVIGSRERAPA